MRLIRWRQTNRISSRVLSDMVGVKSSGTLSRIERGEHWPRPEIVLAIEMVTGMIGPAPVTADDHADAWLACHPQVFRRLTAEVRAAMQARKSAEQRTETDGEECKQQEEAESD